MGNITVEVPVNIDIIIKKLTIKDKIELTKKLEKITIGKRIDNLLKRIDFRSEKNPISQETINNVIKQVRKELYGQSCS
ncbi:MAG: hypothetical protein AB1765_00925 [Candidatus Hydrogenedentota bacterium]